MSLLKNSVKIKLLDEEMFLLPQKAIYIERESTLLIADLHLGKAGHFRNAGIPVPPTLAFADLKLLDELISSEELNIKKIILLGDLFHSKINFDWRIFEEWRECRNDIEINLIKGNHDILSASHYSLLNIDVVKAATLNKFKLVHNYKDENDYDGLYKLCGHIHPAVRIYGKARQSVTLPCFYFGADFGVLPAFGSFTGRYVIQPREHDSVFVIMGNENQRKVVKM